MISELPIEAGNANLPLAEFLQYLDKPLLVEERLKLALAYMKRALSQGEKADFKSFWEVRKKVVELFREPVNPILRKELWAEYVDLTREARRLKDLVDEETTFILSQVEIAAEALREEIEAFHRGDESLFARAQVAPFPQQLQTLQHKIDYFQTLQSKINLLSTFATRIQTLRDEIAARGMRIKQKSLYFERLSKLGDQVFPIKRELIGEISRAFLEEVKRFADQNFSESAFSPEKVKRRLFFLREEIKSLQAVAKILTLNTETFSATREILSQAWDKMKGMEKEVKREFAIEKQKSSENTKEIQARLDEVETLFKSGELKIEDLERKLDEILREMRAVDLTGADVRMLKERTLSMRTAIDEKRGQESALRREKERELEQKRQEALEEWKAKLKETRAGLEASPIESLEADLAVAREALSKLSIPKWEKQACEKLLKEFGEEIEDKKERLLLALSDDDKASLKELADLLQQKKDRRAEIKAQLEEYRKIIGGSTLSFEKAMEYNERVAEEKSRLEKIEETLGELEKRVRDLKRSKAR